MKKILLLIFLIPYLGVSQNYIPTKDVYDFDVGDEFHYVTGSSGTIDYLIRKVMGKQILGVDSVRYLFKDVEKRQIVAYQAVYALYITNRSSTYYFPNDTIIDKIPPCLDTFHPYYTPYLVGWGCEWIDSIYSNYSIFGKTYNTEYKPYYNFYRKSFYSKGLGKTYEEERDQSSYPYFWYKRLDYYYKSTSGIFRGTPYTYSLSLNELSKLDFKIYPNPTNDYITIESKDINSELKYQLSNSLGQIVLSGENKKTSINVSSIPTGIYFLKITNGNGDSGIKRIVVSR